MFVECKIELWERMIEILGIPFRFDDDPLIEDEGFGGGLIEIFIRNLIFGIRRKIYINERVEIFYNESLNFSFSLSVISGRVIFRYTMIG